MLIKNKSKLNAYLIFFFFIGASIIHPHFLQADLVQDKINLISVKLTDRFKEKVKTPDFQLNLGIVSLQNKSKEAIDNDIGATLTDLLMKKFSESIIFKIVDRQHLQILLKEAQLSQMGITESKEQLGQLKTLDYLLVGTVTSLGENFNISISFVSTGTGEIIASEQISLEKNKLIERAKLYHIEYVTQHSIGITLDYNVIPGQDANNSSYKYANLLINYRFTRNLLTSFGVALPLTVSMGFGDKVNFSDQVLYNFGEKNIAIDKVLTDIQDFNTNGGALVANPGFNIPAGSVPTKMMGLYNRNFTSSGIAVNQYYIFNLHRYVNLGMGAGMTVFLNPQLTEEYHLIPRKINQNTAVLDRAMIYVDAKQPIFVFKAEVRPEIYITPRLTLRLYAGYTLNTRFVPKRAQYRDSIILSKEENAQKRDETFYELLGLNPFLDPVSAKRIGVDFSGIYFGGGIGFWF